MSSEKLMTVAICEDHEIVREGIKAFVDRFGQFNVTLLAENCPDLVHKLSLADIVPDILILDVQMRPVNGWDTSVIVRKQWPEIKILMLTCLEISEVIS